MAMSSKPTPNSNLDSRIKCLGPGLYDFVDEDGTFADWLRENPYSDDEAKDPIVHMTKDPLIQESEKTSAKRYPSIHEITKPSVMFMKQVIMENTTDQTSLVDEILTRRVFQCKIDGTLLGKQKVPIQKQVKQTQKAPRRKIVTTVVTKPKTVAKKAAKPMSDLLKISWKAKARIASQATKNGKEIKRVKNMAPSTMVICSFKD